MGTARRVRVRRAGLFPWLLVGPYLLMFAVFIAYPILRAVYISFFDWGIFGPDAFVGLENYVALAGDERFWRAVRITGAFALIYVPMIVGVSMVLAVLLHGRLPGIAVFRTAFLVPIVINVSVAAIAFRWLIEPQIGLLNRLLALVGLPGQAWLSEPGWALFAIALVTLWINAGFMIVIYLAALENIPDELYEAARLDGIGPVGEFFRITAPLLRPITLLVTVLSLITAFQVFGEVLMMTGGGPFGSTTVLTLLLYEEGFQKFALGRAAAIGVVITALIAALSFVQFRLFRERGGAA